MEKLKNIETGVLTASMNVENREFNALQLFLKKRADALNEKQKLELELFALQIKMEDYLNAHEDEQDVLTVGDFLRLYLDKLNIKQNVFAKYLGLNPSNFNKILTANRKLNFELSFMLGQIFNVDPKIWMLIQVKNEYIKLKNDKAEDFKRFKLEDLVTLKK